MPELKGPIHWGDETALVNTDVRGRSYAPSGKTPVPMAIGDTRHKLPMIATVTNQAKPRGIIIDEAFDAGWRSWQERIDCLSGACRMAAVALHF